MPRPLFCVSDRYLAHFTRAVALLCCTLPAFAQDYQSLESIQTAAKDFAYSQLQDPGTHVSPPQITIGALDARLQLAACEIPLQAFLPPGSRMLGNTSVGVRCQGSRPWSLYVPVTVKAFGEVLVTTRPLPRGAQLGADDLRLAAVDITSLPADYLADPQQAVGKILKQPLAGGAVLAAAVLEARRLVRRNERITLLAEGQGLMVRMSGLALADGVSGEIIQVRNVLSKRVVEGTVISPGVVKVAM
ncbi:MAG: flagellar basal body P-ring formation chaperone FlgA [Pseudomonadota bacterium]